ncbi:MAG: PfkB family carbohydrate kinase, partial [Methanobrevibacter sp.]|nr:PfkB family carbohydrate kinase [Methanobrevibacter sp.]
MEIINNDLNNDLNEDIHEDLNEDLPEDLNEDISEDLSVDVIGFGALNLDNVYYVNEIAKEDQEAFIKGCDSTFGGSAANTIVGLSKLGIKTSYIGKIADDEEGEILEMGLTKAGVYLNNIIYADKGHSGKVIGFIDDEGNRALYVDPGVNDEIDITEITIEEV